MSARRVSAQRRAALGTVAAALDAVFRGGRLSEARSPTSADVEIVLAVRGADGWRRQRLALGGPPRVARVASKGPARADLSGFARFLRRWLVGAAVSAVQLRDDALELVLEGRDGPFALRVPAAVEPLEVVDGDGRVRAVSAGRSAAARAPAAVLADPPAVAPDEAAWAAAEAHLGADGDGEGRRALRRGVKRAASRAARLVRGLEADLARADGADALRLAGEVLKVSLGEVPAGAAEVTLAVPWQPGESVAVPLQRGLSPAANLDRIFRRARGLAAARADIARRLELARQRADALASLLRDADTLPVDALERATQALGLAPPQTPVVVGAAPAAAKRGRASGALPAGVQRFETSAGRELFVGRSAAANDALVGRVARGRDLWLHVRDAAGAHGVLRCAAGEPTPERDLREAAALVAWLSGCGRGDRVDVTWTAARNVTKAKGQGPGRVYVRDEHVVRVDVERAVVDGFYQRAGRGNPPEGAY